MTGTGRFITMEGGEGVGKTTNLEFVAEWLRERGIVLCMTREPGGTELGERLRALLLDADGPAPCSLAELLLIFAARAQHLAEVIEPALARGEWVLCDRFTDATFAYQGYGRHLDIDVISQLERLVQGQRRPDLVLLLDADPRVGMQRAHDRGAPDRFERENMAFFDRVREGYLERVRSEPQRYQVIDAAQPLAEVSASLARTLEAFVDG